MKRIFTVCTLLGLAALSLAQGIQGNVTLSGNATIVVTEHSVTLTWNASQGATAYNVYRGTIHGGPYTQLHAGITGTAYIDVQVTHNQTLYYVVTAVNGSQESGYSSESVAVIP